MGIFNEVKSLITVKADTSQAKAEIKSLAGIEKEAAKERLAGLEAGNKKLESSMANWAKAAGALTAVGVAGKIAFDAIEFSGRRADLQAAAGSVSIERLRKATLGLRTDTQLLEMAGKLNHAQIKLTAEQMDIAGRAATALAERGGDAEEAFEAVTTALVTGRTRGLAPFGIQIDETKDKAEKFTSLMRELGKVQGEVSEATLDASDKIAIQKNKFSNVFDAVQDGIGKVASEMLPLLETLMSVGSVVAGLVGGVDGALSGIGRIAKYGIPVYGQVLLVRDAVSGNVTDIAASYLGSSTGGLVSAFHAGRALGTGGLSVGAPGPWRGAAGAMNYAGTGTLQKLGRSTRVGRGGDADALARERADEDSEVAEIWAQHQNDGLISRISGGQSAIAGQNAGDLEIRGRAMEDFLANTKEELADLEFMREDSSKPTVLERMFGKHEEIDGYREAWSGLMGVVSAGYDAMVDGSMSFGQAAKRAAGDAIKALGLKMLIEAAEQTATGVKMLAGVYTAPLAAGHFSAAAKYGAGAVLAGVVASQLGSGGGMPSAGGGGSSGGSGYRPSAPSSYNGIANVEQRTAPIILVGDPFGYDSPRNQQKNAKRLTSLAYGDNAVSYG